MSLLSPFLGGIVWLVCVWFFPLFKANANVTTGWQHENQMSRAETLIFRTEPCGEPGSHSGLPNGMNHVLRSAQAISSLLLTAVNQGLQSPCRKGLHLGEHTPLQSPQGALSLLWTRPMQPIPLHSPFLPSHPPCPHLSNSKLLLQSLRHQGFTAEFLRWLFLLFLIRSKTTYFSLAVLLEIARLVLAAIFSKISSDVDT